MRYLINKISLKKKKNWVEKIVISFKIFSFMKKDEIFWKQKLICLNSGNFV